MNYKADRIAINPKYDGYQRGLSSMVYKFFDKKAGLGVNVNEVLALLSQDLHKFKRRKVDLSFDDNIWAADLA